MSLNKKILATAIVGGLFATAAQAQVVLNTDGVATNTIRLGSEITLPATVNFVAPAVVTADDIRTNVGFNFSNGDVKHVRLECSSNVRITGATATLSGFAQPIPPAAAVAIAAADFNIGAVNGAGTNAIFFAITDAAGSTNNIASGTLLDIAPQIQVRSAGTVSCSYALYDEASQASNGGSTGRIGTTLTSGNYATFAPSFAYQITPGTTTISSSANPIYTGFTATGVNSAANARIGLVAFNQNSALPTAGNDRVNAAGATLTLAALLGSGSEHIVEGDMSALANEDGTFTGDALNRLYIDNDGICANTPAGEIYPVAMTASSATFRTGAAAVPNTGVCFVDRAGVAIPTSAYTIRFVPQPFDATVNPGAIGATTLGTLLRDGTDLVAPLVQVPTGWISRIVLNNTSAVSRPYTISVQGETGNTITTSAGALTGTIPARGTTVIDVPSFLTGFTGAPRATVNVSIAAPRTAINGLYQIVNPASGSISNHVMVAAGTN